MDLLTPLQWLLVIFVLVLSLPVGYLLGKIAKEELINLKSYLNGACVVFFVCFFASLFTLFFSLTLQALFVCIGSVFLLGLLRGSSYYLK